MKNPNIRLCYFTTWRFCVCLAFFGLLASCGGNEIPSNCTTGSSPETNEANCQASRGEDDVTDGSTRDDRADESVPSFAKPTTANPTVTPSATPSPSVTQAPQPDGSKTPAPVTSDGKYGVNGNMSCSDYVARFWKVGAQTYEEAPAPLFQKLKFTTTVLSINGSSVTINTKLVTPDASKNVDETITFDACTEGHLTAVPKTKEPCLPVADGSESVTVNGKTVNAKKFRFQNCVTTDDKTFSSTVWRAEEIPLWGAIKREVTGTVVPSELNGKISAGTTSWKFE